MAPALARILATVLALAVLIAPGRAPIPVTHAEDQTVPFSWLEDTVPTRPEPLNVASRTLVNGRFLILNMHGLLFHDYLSDIQQNVDYARWMNAGVIRVFATDASRAAQWTGGQVAERIIEIAPMLREANIKLIVALVNNHQEVPGEDPEAVGWMDDYHQLLLPFYRSTWRFAYRQYITDLTWLVKERGARDVIWAWEVGNEIHTPQEPELVLGFIDGAVKLIREVDDQTPILPGIMGSNHLEPMVEESDVAREVFCRAQVAAYTLHTYDWRDEYNGGDMPIHWDLRHIVRHACENGRALPVIVEELGTSRELPGVYAAHEEDRRFQSELRQIRFVLANPSVAAVGAWSAESPYTRRLRHDRRRGLTSYGPDADGTGSCYLLPEGAPSGARCQLEQVLRNLPQVP